MVAVEATSQRGTAPGAAAALPLEQGVDVGCGEGAASPSATGAAKLGGGGTFRSDLGRHQAWLVSASTTARDGLAGAQQGGGCDLLPPAIAPTEPARRTSGRRKPDGDKPTEPAARQVGRQVLGPQAAAAGGPARLQLRRRHDVKRPTVARAEPYGVTVRGAARQRQDGKPTEAGAGQVINTVHSGAAMPGRSHGAMGLHVAQLTALATHAPEHAASASTFF